MVDADVSWLYSSSSEGGEDDGWAADGDGGDQALAKVSSQEPAVASTKRTSKFPGELMPTESLVN